MPSRDEALAERTALVERLRAHIPNAMRERKQWLLWRLEEVEGRDGLQKVPYYISGRKRFGDLGGEADLRALASFDDALKRFAGAAHFTGVGFAFLANDGLVGVDLDGMFDLETGEVNAEHRAIVEACASYSERSVSGAGMHIITLGHTDSFKHDPCGVEVYCGGRYFTCTGLHYEGTPAQVTELKPYALAYMRDVVQRSKDAVRAAKEAASAPAAAAMRRVQPAGQGGNDFKRVNEAAYVNLDAWVPQVFPKASRKGYGWRVTSKALGRDLQEDLQLSTEGIMDFGEERSMSPIDVVMKWCPGMATAKDAMQWLAPIVGVQLEPRRRLSLVAPARQDERPEPPPPPHEEGTASAAPKRGKGGKDGGGPNAPKKGGGGKLATLLKHYALIRGTDTVWDGEQRTVMAVKALRLLFGTAAVNEWLADTSRTLLLPEQIRFEPGQELEDGSVNLFDGMPTEPVECSEKDVEPILMLLRHLCSLSAPTPAGCQAVYEQVLKWCALIVQQPGAKLRFALVFHGPQGTGKNMFFDTFRKILGKYGKMVGQGELEDKFNGYMSGKLLLVANEVMTRAELFHGKNKLKWVITEDEIPIRGMHQEVRWESNHANVVFLSNEIQPLALEKDDRRHLVVYTPAAEDGDLYLRCADFIRDDGPAKFMHYLLKHVDLDGFNEYTRPLMTEAKLDLIALGLKPQERFAGEWLEGLLDLPVRVCSAEQLFRVYRRWAEHNGVRWPGEQGMFTETVKRYVFEKRDEVDGVKQEPRLTYKVIQLKDPGGARKAVRCWVPRGCKPDNGVTEGEWAWPSVEAFEPLVRRFGHYRSEEADS